VPYPSRFCSLRRVGRSFLRVAFWIFLYVLLQLVVIQNPLAPFRLKFVASGVSDLLFLPSLRRGLYNSAMDAKTHWEKVYATKAPDQVSWFRPHLETSVALIERSVADHSASIIDIGGGESTLVDDLLARGFQNVTVLDVSQVAIDATRKRLGHAADRVHWLTADITQLASLPSAYDVWHDRAVFHFLTAPEQRAAYVQQAARSVKPGGHVIVSTFGPEGPTKCSGLDVVRYDAESLHDQFGTRFRLVESSKELHETPLGTTQQFLYCYCRVEAR
jgi:2-polyprenyl-3-methyl-5-hydroxy-6-metoxy-1,4-benzoquinol methylase